MACTIMKMYLQMWDQIIMARRDKEKYYFKEFRETTVKTRMGEVNYKRRYYKIRGSNHVFLLDEAMGIKTGYGLVSESLAEQIVIECSDKSFRKAAETIGNLTGQTISAMGAWDVTRRFGEKLKRQETRLKELDRKGVTGQLGKLFCKVLFGEYDDVWLSMQNKKRQPKGAVDKAKRKKAGKKPMHVGTAYTGWVQEKDGRYRTMDRIANASFGDAKEFVSGFETILRHRFDMDGVECRVMNGDGASWIKTAADESDAILQLDPFHRSRAILKAIDEKNDRRAVFEAIKEKNVEKVLETIGSLINKTVEEKSYKKLAGLYSYFYGNKDNLLTWQERGEILPTPLDGVVYRNLGVQESSNCDLITYRMKHGKRSWSTEGANNMGIILCYRNTIGIDIIKGALPLPPSDIVLAYPLSSAKTPLYDGNGYDGWWLHAEKPFEQAFMTNGREAIRKVLSQKPLADLTFI